MAPLVSSFFLGFFWHVNDRLLQRVQRAATRRIIYVNDRPQGKTYDIHVCVCVYIFLIYYPLVNKQLDPENHQFLMETSLPTPMTVRVYVNLPEGTFFVPVTTVQSFSRCSPSGTHGPRRNGIRRASTVRACSSSQAIGDIRRAVEPRSGLMTGLMIQQIWEWCDICTDICISMIYIYINHILINW